MPASSKGRYAQNMVIAEGKGLSRKPLRLASGI